MPPDHSYLTAHRSATGLVLGSVASLLLAACTPGTLGRDSAREPAAPVNSRNTAAMAQLGGYFEELLELAQGEPAQQAQIFVAAQREHELLHTPATALRYGLALAVAGHGASDPQAALVLLKEALADPAALAPVERALAALELRQIEQQLALDAENRRLQDVAERGDRERMAVLNRKFQAELEESARLRKELEEARAKLDAIMNIERSINDRTPPATEGRRP